MAAALWDAGRPRESTPIPCWSLEPRVAPPKVWAKGVSSSEMNVSWEPVQQDMNGILLGYEVSAGRDWRGRGLGVGCRAASQLRSLPPRSSAALNGHAACSLCSTAFAASAQLSGWCLWTALRLLPGGSLEQEIQEGHGLPLSCLSPALLACSGQQRTAEPPHHPVPEELWPSGF